MQMRRVAAVNPSVRMWILWFRSAGVFAEVLAGRAMGYRLPSPQILLALAI